MRGRALVAVGSILIVVGMFVLSPAIWVLLDQMFQQFFGAPLIGVVLGGGGLIVPLILTSLGTAGIIGGAWMIASGTRRRREVVRAREQVPRAVEPRPVEPRPVEPKPVEPKPANEPLDRPSIGE
jgi:hypothetical protein